MRPGGRQFHLGHRAQRFLRAAISRLLAHPLHHQLHARRALAGPGRALREHDLAAAALEMPAEPRAALLVERLVGVNAVAGVEVIRAAQLFQQRQAFCAQRVRVRVQAQRFTEGPREHVRAVQAEDMAVFQPHIARDAAAHAGQPSAGDGHMHALFRRAPQRRRVFRQNRAVFAQQRPVQVAHNQTEFTHKRPNPPMRAAAPDADVP